MALSLLERTVELKLWLSPEYKPIFRGTWLAMRALEGVVLGLAELSVSEPPTCCDGHHLLAKACYF